MIYHDFVAESPMSFSFFRSNFQEKMCGNKFSCLRFQLSCQLLLFVHFSGTFYFNAFITPFLTKIYKNEEHKNLQQNAIVDTGQFANIYQYGTAKHIFFFFSFFAFVCYVRYFIFRSMSIAK